MMKFRKLRLNQTVRRKTRDELNDANFLLMPLGCLVQVIQLPLLGGSMSWSSSLGSSLLMAVMSIIYLIGQKQRRRRLYRVAIATDFALQEVDAKISIPKLILLWAFAVIGTIVMGFISGSYINAVLSAPLTPSWQRAWLIGGCNVLGLCVFWYWRALFNFSSELLCRPATTAVAPVATIAAPAVTPQAASVVVQNVAPPAATLSAGQGKLTP